jgi:predicted O-linked N-acetylglucosamine transferase (SPINDLY family)
LVVREHRSFGAHLSRNVVSDAQAVVACGARSKLRVGYLSGDFRRHSVAYFLESMWAAHDPDRVEVVAYHNTRHFDEMSERLKGYVSKWVPCKELSDEALVKRIRADGVDVLIDLSGLTSDGRAGVFAQRAAPVQVSYLGYPTTTGIPAMDFRISDAVIDPVGEEAHATEVVLRCARGMFCYRPDSDGDVGEPPHVRHGFVTFGSFNNLPKYSDQTLELWAAVLKAVPGSKLFLKTRALADEDLQRLLRERFAALGVGAERLLLNPWRPDLRSHLELYREVDIGLDTYPYNGATTTCEALWSGVPVVTLKGATHTSRMGASILRSLGHAEWVAADAQGFVELASSLARQPEVLAAFRAGARDEMRASALMDGAGHTRDFEDLLFQAWQQRCEAASRG